MFLVRMETKTSVKPPTQKRIPFHPFSNSAPAFNLKAGMVFALYGQPHPFCGLPHNWSCL